MLLLLCVLLATVLSGQDWKGWLDSALMLERVGQYREAEALLRKSLAMVQSEGANARDVAVVQNNLGGVLVSQGRYAEAETVLKRSLAHFQADTSGGADWTAALNHLATVYRERGRLRESEAAYRRVLKVRIASADASKEQIARSRSNLAAVLMDQRRFEEARELLEVALGNFAQSPGMHLDRATILMNLAVLETQLGGLKQARLRAEQGVVVLESLARGHPALGKALLTMGCILMKAGQHQAAAERLGRAVHILRTAFPGHPILEEALSAYAEALGKCGRQKEAKLARQESASMGSADERRHTVSVSELRMEAKR